MDNINRFSSYYSGELKGVEEELLFSELASNQSLRNEFKSFTMINSSFTTIVNSYKPSHDRKSRLFERAGLTLPIETVTPNISDAKVPKITLLNKTPYFYNFIQISVSSLITILVMLYLLDLKENTSTYYNRTVTENNKVANEQLNKQEVPIITSENPQIEKEIVYVYKDRYNPQERELTADYSKSKVEILYSEHKKPYDDMNLQNNKNIIYNQFNSNIPNQYKLIDVSNKLNNKWEFSLEHSFPWHLPVATITPESYNKFNNMGIRVLYKVNDYVKIGGGVNQSTFYTQFQGKASDGEMYNYSMQPNLTTITTDFNVKLYNSENLKPYIQLGVGANQAGIVLSPALGIEFDVIEPLSFYFSGTLDYYRFVHNENWFNTQKFRLNYGFSLKL